MAVKPGVPRLLMSAHSGSESATVTTNGSQEEWLVHLEGENRLAPVVRYVDETRATVMHYIDRDLGSL